MELGDSEEDSHFQSVQARREAAAQKKVSPRLYLSRVGADFSP